MDRESTMRQFANRAEYYGCIVESAERTLAKDPDDSLHHEVTNNISGGHDMWNNGADELYQHPKTLEEGLLALEMRSVLERAIANQLKVVRAQCREEPIPLNIFGLPMDFGLLTGTVIKYAWRDRHAAMLVKIEMAKLAYIADRLSLADFLGKHCLSDPDGGDQFCEIF